MSRGGAFNQKCDFPFYYAKNQHKTFDFKRLRVFQNVFKTFFNDLFLARARAVAPCMCYPHLLATVSRGVSFDQKCDFPFYYAKNQHKTFDFKWLRIFQSVFKTFFNDLFLARARAVAPCMCYPHLLATVSRGVSFDQKCDFPFLHAQKQYKPLDFKWLRIFQSLFFY